MISRATDNRHWYIAKDGRSTGPYTLNELGRRVQEGSLSRHDFVWAAGMNDWGKAGAVPQLFPLPPDLPDGGRKVYNDDPSMTNDDADYNLVWVDEDINDLSAQRAATPELEDEPIKFPRDNSSFISKHWRGELSLAVSYWIMGVGVTLVLTILSYLFFLSLEGLRNPSILGASLFIFIVILLAVSVWQVVGIWRSAGRSISADGRYLWPILARIVVVMTIVRLGVEYTNVTGPMLQESYRLAVEGEGLPNAEVLVDSKLRAVVLNGGMPYGTSEKLATVLEAAPDSRFLILNSIGGNIKEGVRIGEMISKKNIAVAVTQDCLSACALAFLYSKDRYLALSGRLGFHSASFGALDNQKLPEINENARSLFSKLGLPDWFVVRALNTPSKDMWYPTRDELNKAGILRSEMPSHVFRELSMVDLAKQLELSSKSLNETLPKRLDKATVLIETRTEGVTLFYRYKLDWTAGGFDARKFMSSIEQTVVERMCKNLPQRKLLERGTKYAYSYADANGQAIGEFVISKQHCDYRSSLQGG